MKYSAFKINPFITCATLVFGLIAGFRLLGVGTDFENYVTIFSTTDEYSGGIEPFWILIRKLTIHFGGAPLVFILVSCFTLSVFYKTAKKYTGFKYIAFIFYLLTFYLLHQYTQIRAAVAISIFFLSLEDLKKRNFKSYLFKTLLAVCFHYSAILMLVLYVYTGIKNSFFYLLVPVILFFADIFIIDSVSGWIAMLLDQLVNRNIFFQLIVAKIRFQSGEEFSIFNKQYLSFLFVLILFAYLFVLNKKHKTNENELAVYKILSFVCFSFYAIFPTGLTVLLFRVPEFFSSVIILALLMIPTRFKEKRLVVFFCFLYMALLMLVFYRAVFNAE